MNARAPQALGAQVETAWMAAMRAGDFESAWRATDLIELPRRARQAAPDFVRDPSHLVWDGTPFDGKVVRVRCLHGLGDTLQFMRFVPVLAARAERVHFLVQPMLLDLLRGAPGLGEVSNAWTDDPPDADVEIEVMELAYALRCPGAWAVKPYADLASQLPSAPRVEVSKDSRTRAALLWSASDWDTNRSIPLGALRELVQMPGTVFYSLQHGAAAQDPLVEQLGITALSRETERIVDAASAMTQMDLVIAVDGMPAHLAATLGRATWLMLKHDADWRWMESRSDTPWYPAMRLFRQPHAGDWTTVARDVAQALRDLRSSA